MRERVGLTALGDELDEADNYSDLDAVRDFYGLENYYEIYEEGKFFVSTEERIFCISKDKPDFSEIYNFRFCPEIPVLIPMFLLGRYN